MRSHAIACHRQRADAGAQAGPESMNFRILGAILKKDVQSLLPLVLLTIALFAGDVLIVRLELLGPWGPFRQPVLFLASMALIFSVFQLDSPVSLVDDWLCRPVPRRELIVAKMLLVIAVVYLTRVVTTLLVDLGLGWPLANS